MSASGSDPSCVSSDMASGARPAREALSENSAAVLAEGGLHAVILAAGRGTRMPSPRPKALQTLLGESMLALVRRTVCSLPEVDRVWTVVGCEAEQVIAELRRLNAASGMTGGEPDWILQEQQMGTGHALMAAMPRLAEAGARRALIVNADVPLVSADQLHGFLLRSAGADVAFLSLRLADAGSYGRVLRDAAGRVQAIVEAKDYDPSVHGPDSGEINTGIYAVSMEAARRLLPMLDNANRSGEYYITDLIRLGVEQGMEVRGLAAASAREGGAENADLLALLGMNTPRELAEAEAALRERRAAELLAAGVLLHAPESVRVSPMAVVEAGAELFGPCEIYGNSHVAFGAVVESHCVLRNAQVAAGARVRSFCHVEDAVIGPRCQVGPYARLRPGAVLEEDAHMGNFVEMKKARLGRGAKANHLTYLGDAEVGAGANIGAGTITCNYDGVNKHRTTIGEGAFIGSNTALVAPVAVGKNALVGAGSVITKDVPDSDMGIARARQVNLKRRGN